MWIKICGVTTVADAEMVVEAGASAIGLNFVPTSPRRVTTEQARAIAQAVRGRVELVGVFADQLGEMKAVADTVGLDWLQLHGSETPLDLALAGPNAMKAVRVGEQADVLRARDYGGARILVDALVHGTLGGTGQVLDWSLVEQWARERPLVLAGGLRPENVGRAIGQVRPFGVDTASGVELEPGRKSPKATLAFVASARAAAEALQGRG